MNKKQYIVNLFFQISYNNYNYNYNDNNDNESLWIKLIDKIDKFLDKKIKIFTNSIKPKIGENGSDSENESENKRIKQFKSKNLFEKSTIIENDYERRLLIYFIKENDKIKNEIMPCFII